MGVYLNSFSVQLGTERLRWTVGNMVVNHSLFADDLCVWPQRPSTHPESLL